MPESFFIETLTGACHPVTHTAYLGIESVWNHKNYWVNMQDCAHGVQVHVPMDIKYFIHTSKFTFLYTIYNFLKFCFGYLNHCYKINN